jgi:hypothetical protein
MIKRLPISAYIINGQMQELEKDTKKQRKIEGRQAGR